jgi:hypothetical protein
VHGHHRLGPRPPLGVPAAAVNTAIALHTDLAEGKLSWAPQLRELLGFVRVRTTLGHANRRGGQPGRRAPEPDRADVIACPHLHFGWFASSYCSRVQPRVRVVELGLPAGQLRCDPHADDLLVG